MQILRSADRRKLDARLAHMSQLVGIPPPIGWSRTIRRVLRMSRHDLGQRMGVSDARVGQLERGEVSGSIQLATLRRLAAAFDCRLIYVFVPRESLETMVRRQARLKALAEATEQRRADDAGDVEFIAALQAEQFEARVVELVDSPGLWRTTKTRPSDDAPPSS